MGVLTSQEMEKFTIEILNRNLVYLTHRDTEAFGSDLFLLLNVF